MGITFGLRTLDSIAFGLQPSLNQVEHLIGDQLKSNDPVVSEVLGYVRRLSGKRLRPILTLLSAKICGGINEDAIRMAVVTELVHTATLIHDDLIDDAQVRRHLPSVHRKWTARTAILTGDWLFTRAYHLANEGDSVLPGQWVADAARRICEAELRQDAMIGQRLVSEDQYLRIVEGKTGQLCSVSCRLGAWAAGGDCDAFDALAKYGMLLGTAFQIQDDWLDYWGDEQSMGKPLHGDLRTQKVTLPLIRWLAMMSAPERSEWLEELNRFGSGNQSKILSALIESKACESVRETAVEFASQAERAIPTPGDPDVRLALSDLARLAVARIK